MFGDNTRHLWHKIKGRNSTNDAAEAGVDDHDKTVLDMKVQRDTLVQTRRRLERECQKDEEVAKDMARDGRKELALLALRKKKHHQQLVTEAQNHLFRLEQLIDDVESAQMQKDAVNALAAGVGTLRRLQQEIGGADRVQRLMDDVADAADEQREISNALAGLGIAEDDADAAAEFERMQAEIAAQALSPDAGAAKPAAVTVEPVAPLADAGNPAAGSPSTVVARPTAA